MSSTIKTIVLHKALQAQGDSKVRSQQEASVFSAENVKLKAKITFLSTDIVKLKAWISETSNGNENLRDSVNEPKARRSSKFPSRRKSVLPQINKKAVTLSPWAQVRRLSTPPAQPTSLQLLAKPRLFGETSPIAFPTRSPASSTRVILLDTPKERLRAVRSAYGVSASPNPWPRSHLKLFD